MTATNYKPGGKSGFRTGSKNALWSVESHSAQVQLRKSPRTGGLMFRVATSRNGVSSVRTIHLENTDTSALVDLLNGIGHPGQDPSESEHLQACLNAVRKVAQDSGRDADACVARARAEWDGSAWKDKPCERAANGRHKKIFTVEGFLQCEVCGRGTVGAVRVRMDTYFTDKG